MPQIDEALASLPRTPRDTLVLRPSARGAVFTCLLLSGISGGASAQSAAGNPPDSGAHTHSPVAAGLIEWIVPTAGFAYGGDWTRGFLPNAVRIGGLVGILATCDGPGDTTGDGCGAFAIVSLAGGIWAIVGAVSTAQDHNAGVRAATSRLEVSPGPEQSLGLGLRFGLW